MKPNMESILSFLRTLAQNNNREWFTDHKKNYLEEIKYKHFIFSKNYKDSEISKKGFAQNVIANYQGLFPLVQYLNLAISFSGNE